MTLHLQRDRDHPRRPWRNGGGTTAEVACAPAGADAASGFDWRISFAEVSASGDFSLFPDVDRVIVLVDGPPMTLRLPGSTHQLRRGEPFAFDGAVPVSCEVAAPTRDLNVMTRRGRAAASVEVVRLAPVGPPRVLAPGRPLVLATLTGAVRVVGDGATALLRPGDVVSSDGPLRVEGRGCVAVVRILPATTATSGIPDGPGSAVVYPAG